MGVHVNHMQIELYICFVCICVDVLYPPSISRLGDTSSVAKGHVEVSFQRISLDLVDVSSELQFSSSTMVADLVCFSLGRT